MSLTNFIQQVNIALKRAPFLAMLLGASCVFGAWRSFSTNAGKWDSPLALLLLAIVSGAYGVAHLETAKKDNSSGKFAWLLLALSFVLMGASIFTDSECGKNMALLLGCSSVAVYLEGRRCLKLLALPLLLCYIVLPFLENITLYCSYPLRLLSTEFTVGILQVFHVDISSRLTTIFIGKTQIAITDACSGVSQLGVLLFFTWILAVNLPATGQMRKIIWCIFILPIVIIANTVRLLATVGLFYAVGERAFENDIHTALGYSFILLSLIMLWGCGKALTPAEEGKSA